MEKIGNVNIKRYYVTDDCFFDYVDFDEIPEEYKKEFGEWMYGQTIPYVENCKFPVYSWDYERWYLMKTKNKPTYFD